MTKKQVNCGWGTFHPAHPHPGLDNTQCPGACDMSDEPYCRTHGCGPSDQCYLPGCPHCHEDNEFLKTKLVGVHKSTPQPGIELVRRLRETANGYYTGLIDDVDTVLLAMLAAHWSEQLEQVAELTRQRNELLAACEKLVARGDGGHASDNCAPMYGCSCGLEGELDAATAAIASARGTAVQP